MSDQYAILARAGDAAADLVRLREPSRSTARRTDSAWALARAIADVTALVVTSVITGLGAAESLGVGWHALLVLTTLGSLALSGVYRTTRRLSLAGEARRVLSASGAAMLSVACLALILTDRAGAGDAIAAYWLVSSCAITAGRAAVMGAQRTARSRAAGGSRTLIVGAGRVGRLAAARLLDDRDLGLRPVGFLDKDPLDHDDAARALDAGPDLPVLGASWDLEEVVADQRIEQVVVAFSTAPHRVLLDLVRRCWRLGVGVLVVPRLYEVEGSRVTVEHLGALPLVGFEPSDPRGWKTSIKHAADRIVAVIAIALLSPLLGGIALAIRLTMGAPVLFRQQRAGRDGQPFEMLKFRTMNGAPEEHGEADAEWASLVLGVPGLEPAALATAVDDRRTALGSVLRKLSLDELPQLWNIARGDMSLVGPRPERVQYVERFGGAIERYPERHRVKAGLTGWAQINGLRGETSLEDRIEWDNFYIENWSLWLDLKILVRTLPALLGRGGD